MKSCYFNLFALFSPGGCDGDTHGGLCNAMGAEHQG